MSTQNHTAPEIPSNLLSQVSQDSMGLPRFDKTLNEGQNKAFELMRDFIEDNSDAMFVLKGYAGTGKTYLVKTLIRYIHTKHKKFHIAITAPTNKAVRVVRKASGISDWRINFNTIHKLLGLKESFEKDGTIKFVPKQPIQNNITQYDILIVDETSMLDDSLFQEIKKHAKKVKIIFLGDPMQIPPVGKQDCLPFKEESVSQYNLKVFELTEIMRQAVGNPIVEYAYQVRINSHKNFPIDKLDTCMLDNGHGVIRADKPSMRTLLNQHFNTGLFKDNPDYAKVIAWRNVTVDKVNFIIRELLYGDMIDRIVIGEKLIANSPVIDKTDVILFSTSDEFAVKSFDIQTDKFQTIRTWIKLKYYWTEVEYLDIDGNTTLKKIMILHEDSFEEFNKSANEYKEYAISEGGMYGTWRRYYDWIRAFADVKYNYAISAHKSQGSSYTNVFILEDDIDLNKNLVERNRIKYTAYSRPTDKLFILKS